MKAEHLLKNLKKVLWKSWCLMTVAKSIIFLIFCLQNQPPHYRPPSPPLSRVSRTLNHMHWFEVIDIEASWAKLSMLHRVKKISFCKKNIIITCFAWFVGWSTGWPHSRHRSPPSRSPARKQFRTDLWQSPFFLFLGRWSGFGCTGKQADKQEITTVRKSPLRLALVLSLFGSGTD